MSQRETSLERSTNETQIEVKLKLDGDSRVEVRTGLPFLDHMLTALAFHAGWDLRLECRGDLEVDDHHTVEDCALALGAGIPAPQWVVSLYYSAFAQGALKVISTLCYLSPFGDSCTARCRCYGLCGLEHLAQAALPPSLA